MEKSGISLGNVMYGPCMNVIVNGYSPLFSTNVKKRSAASKARKNRKSKERRRQIKEGIKLEGRNKLLNLQHELTTVKHQVNLLKGKVVVPIVSRKAANSNRPNIFSHRSDLSVIEKVDDKVKRLSSSSLSIGELNTLGKGCFGTVKALRLHDFSMTVAAKNIKGSPRASILSEVLLMEVVSGHMNFPFLHGLLDEKTILMEMVGTSDGNTVTAALTLKGELGCEVPKRRCFKYASAIVDAMQFLHGKGILHNDLHTSNILIQPVTRNPKIIDFGKATLASHPLVLKKTLSADQKLQYKRLHRHIAYELWNVYLAKQCPATDAYSVGYIFQTIGHLKRISLLNDISRELLVTDPEKRMTLAQASLMLIKL